MSKMRFDKWTQETKMTTNWKKFQLQTRKLHNHMCLIHDTEIVRLIGVNRDKYDYYFTVLHKGGRLVHETAVGHCYSLKGKIPQGSYDRMDSIFGYNNAGPREHFEITEDK